MKHITKDPFGAKKRTREWLKLVKEEEAKGERSSAPRGFQTKDIEQKIAEAQLREQGRYKYETKDSGKREEYKSGMRRDTQEGKANFYLTLALDVPFNEQMLTRWADLMTRGANKYGDRNWEKSGTDEELQRFKASAMRHFVQWITEEDDEDHASAVFFNITAVERLKYLAEQEKE